MAAEHSRLLGEEDYHTIEAAMLETARGRWFLGEYSRRNRAADTIALLGAIGKLEDVVREQRRRGEAQRIHSDLSEMTAAIARTRSEIAEIKPSTDKGGRIDEATEELDAIVDATEAATSEILTAAEAIQDATDALRAAPGEMAPLDKLDAQVIDVFTACSFQDITGQRIRKVVQVLRYLETRLNAMIQIWSDAGETAPAPPADTRPDAHLLNGPARDGEGMDQSDVDDLIADFDRGGGMETKSETAPIAPQGEAAPSARNAELARRLKSLAPKERLILFS